jgi:hypothetical protein
MAVFRTRRMVMRQADGRREVEALAEKLDMRQLRESTAEPDEGIALEIVWQLTPATELYFLQDYRSNTSFLVVQGDAAEQVAQFGAMIAEYLNVWSLDELVENVERAANPTDRARATILAGVGAPNEYDQRFFDLIRAAMFDRRDIPMRTAGVWAPFYSGWPEFAPLLERVARDDPFSELREEAEFVLENIRRRSNHQ